MNIIARNIIICLSMLGLAGCATTTQEKPRLDKRSILSYQKKTRKFPLTKPEQECFKKQGIDYNDINPDRFIDIVKDDGIITSCTVSVGSIGRHMSRDKSKIIERSYVKLSREEHLKMLPKPGQIKPKIYDDIK